MITTTLKLDHCWVCLNTAYLEEHHVIPCAYGGTDGPTVTLCASCHGGVHDLSHHIAHNQTPDTLLVMGNDIVPFWTAEMSPRFIYLARVIHLASERVAGSQNKPVKVGAIFDAETHRKLTALKSMLGVRSIDVALAECVHRVYGSLTTGRTK